MKDINIKNNIIYYYNNTVGYIKDDKAVVDTMFQKDELKTYLTEKQNLCVEWTYGVYDRLSSDSGCSKDGIVTPLKFCRIWQLNPDSDVTMRFIGYNELISNHGEPDPADYRVAYDGQIETDNLEEIYEKFNFNHPHGFDGHSLSMSDIIELYDEGGNTFHYVDRFEFVEIVFKHAEPMQSTGFEMNI